MRVVLYISVIEVTLNGEARDVPDGLVVPRLLEELGAHSRLVIVEINGEVIHSDKWEETALRPGDKIEIVTLVGGG